jgi:acetylornithine deacetylase
MSEVLDLHRALVRTRSVSGEEEVAAALVASWLDARGVRCEHLGRTVLARVGPPEGPALRLDSHLDTVPPASGWSRDPWGAERAEGKVFGLGANDAKASVAAMAAAVASSRDAAIPVWLALVEGEETRGEGTSKTLAELGRRGVELAGAVFGEPTGLDIAVAQKGLLILELTARGDSCHAAHAARLGATNALRVLARDLVALEQIDLGPADPDLGLTTLEPTQASAGIAHNVLPATARAVLDLRTVPALPHDAVVARVRAAVASEVTVRSDRLRPRSTDVSARVVRAARGARPEARLFGSATLSDLALLDSVPAIKCGPGVSERSHTADEFVLEDEVLAGERFYRDLIHTMGALA